PDGTQVAFLQWTGSVSQSVNFAAGTYTLSFAAAQRGNYQASSQTFQVLIDGAVVGSFTPPGSSYSVLTTSSFTVLGGAHTVAFSDQSICYLASGKPVLAQDTGIRHLYPTGAGLVTFRTLQEAAAGVEEIMGN